VQNKSPHFGRANQQLPTLDFNSFRGRTPENTQRLPQMHWAHSDRAATFAASAAALVNICTFSGSAIVSLPSPTVAANRDAANDATLAERIGQAGSSPHCMWAMIFTDRIISECDLYRLDD